MNNLPWEEAGMGLYKLEGNDGVYILQLNLSPGYHERPWKLTHSTRGSCGSYPDKQGADDRVCSIEQNI